jgi:hypothetical protein
VTRRLVGTYLVLAAILLIALVIPLGLTFADNQRGDLSARVERDAFTLASLSRDSVADPRTSGRSPAATSSTPAGGSSWSTPGGG